MDDLFRHRELIYTIYREQSFSRAAQKLFIAQPSLSLTVKKLEQQMGVPLFDRTTKPITLTEAGQQYIAAVESIRQVEDSFDSYLRSVNHLEAGSLGIGSNQLLSSLVLPRFISAFAQKYPGIHLSLLDANSTTLENEISAGHLDIVIDNQVLPGDIFEQRHLATERLYLAVPANFKENIGLENHQLSFDNIANGNLSPAPVPLERFTHVPFILMNRNNDARRHTDAIFEATDFRPQVLFEMDRLATLYAYIEMGTAASVVSDTLIRNIRGVDHSKILFYPLPTEHAQRQIFISYKRNKFRSKAMDAFIASLGDLAHT
ncbi:MAG: LysR family transcriptional regulator [Oscillospiraceae bacterium]|nr:LysR family transcriptional regulator [Oscillospiraceae bacterium]